MRLALVRVRGRSMHPALRDGDILLVLLGALPRRGGLAIVQLPPHQDGTPRPVGVKRLTGPDPDDPQRYWLESDNRGEGTDSWTFGSVARDDLRGRVLWRLSRRHRRR